MRQITIKRIFKIIITLAVLFLIMLLLSELIKPKYLFKSELESPETELWNEFYSEPKNSIDALFIGNSHVYNGISPAEIYEKCGVTCFDMGTSAQNLPSAYYILNECFKYQSPQYVFLDVAGILGENAFPNDYARTFDDMKWSENKFRAINDAIYAVSFNNDDSDASSSTDSPLGKVRSYTKLMLARIFPVLDFHSRWDELEPGEFDQTNSQSIIKGYCPADRTEPVVKDEFYTDSEVFLNNSSKEWFQKIKLLCDENEASLIAICIPHKSWNSAKWTAINGLTRGFGVAFVDYNIPEIYTQTGIDDNIDYLNNSHLNIYGAQKLSRYIAESLFNSGIFVINRDSDRSEIEAKWNNTVRKWHNELKKADLHNAARLPEYTALLDDPDYAVLLTIDGIGSIDAAVMDEIMGYMDNIGFDMPQVSGKEYLLSGIVIGGRQADLSVTFDGQPAKSSADIDGIKYWAVLNPPESEGIDNDGFGAGSNIVIGDTNHSLHGNELNLVVYSVPDHEIIDSINIDLQYTMNIYR